MRNPLKRLARRPDLPKVPLRARLDAAKQRLTAAKDKAGRIVAMNRIMLTKIQEPEPAVDRIALINYATWLHYERRLVCTELYPECGADAHRLVHGDVAADHFHFPPGRRWEDVPKPSTRAVATLDRLGIDWRRDRTGSGWADEKLSSDPGAKLPHGWPKADAALLEALDDVNRLDRAIYALGADDPGMERELNDLPGWNELDDARDLALAKLAEGRAESLLGLQAKAKVLLMKEVRHQGTLPSGVNSWDEIAASLARDLLGLREHQVEPRPDPIFAVIEESKRLEAISLAALPTELETPEKRAASKAAGDALFDYWRNVALKTVPTTGRGCQALARYAAAFHQEQGEPQEDEVYALLGVIARSPLL